MAESTASTASPYLGRRRNPHSNEELLGILASNVKGLTRKLVEGDVVGQIQRKECTFGCKACAFVLFNSQIKSNELGFTPSHICPGHALTKVNCCASGNFQGWRDHETTEKNVLNHLFGIKNGKATRFCQEISEMELDQQRNLIRLHFLNGESVEVHLDRIGADLQNKLLQRFHCFVDDTQQPVEGNGDNNNQALPFTMMDEDEEDEGHSLIDSQDAPNQHHANGQTLADRTVAVNTAQQLSMPPPSTTKPLSRKMNEPLPSTRAIASSPSVGKGRNDMLSVVQQHLTAPNWSQPSSKRQRRDDVSVPSVAHALSPSPALVTNHGSQPTSGAIPADWPFAGLWRDNLQEYERAKLELRKAQEMRDMLLATLEVFNKNRSVAKNSPPNA